MTTTKEATRRVRCPIEDNDPGPTGPIKGCGHEWDEPLSQIADDPDGFVDCGNCGLFFDPDNPNSQPQPGSQ